MAIEGQPLVPGQTNSTKLITNFIRKMTPEAALEERLRLAVDTVNRSSASSHRPRVLKSDISDPTAAFIRGKGRPQRLKDRKRWSKIYDSFSIADRIVIKCDDAKREIHCGCCPAVVRNNNIEFHVKGKKHMNIKVATENKLRQKSMRTSIIKSNKITRNIAENTHLFKVEYLRELLECV